MLRNRAFRRHQQFRMLQKARKIVTQWFGPYSQWKKEWLAHRVSNNLQACSCYMCGNPRKYWQEKTLQEVKNELDFREQVNEQNEL